MKKSVSLVLSLVLCMSLATPTVLAAETPDATSNGWAVEEVSSKTYVRGSDVSVYSGIDDLQSITKETSFVVTKDSTQVAIFDVTVDYIYGKGTYAEDSHIEKVDVYLRNLNPSWDYSTGSSNDYLRRSSFHMTYSLFNDRINQGITASFQGYQVGSRMDINMSLNDYTGWISV